MEKKLCALCGSALYVVGVISMVVKTVGVVGAGTMGSGIAQVFAQSGFAVRLVDVSQPMLVRALDSIARSFVSRVSGHGWSIIVGSTSVA